MSAKILQIRDYERQRREPAQPERPCVIMRLPRHTPMFEAMKAWMKLWNPATYWPGVDD